ncbi:hypothetical protein BJM39_16790 [Salmonella enterica subsp. enterica serovar Javiana]|nr:hypothetical protein BJM39_16790 [Salmonella enterica subsp. enterica serovar Javiana]
MFAWKVQTNLKVPGLLGAFIVAVPLGSTFTSKPPSLDVTVWAWESPFLMVTVAPGATDAGTL